MIPGEVANHDPDRKTSGLSLWLYVVYVHETTVFAPPGKWQVSGGCYTPAQGCNKKGEKHVSRPYSSFLIRYWPRYRNQTRVRVEHVQSGDITQVGSLEEAMRWLEGQSNAPPKAKEVKRRERGEQ